MHLFESGTHWSLYVALGDYAFIVLRALLIYFALRVENMLFQIGNQGR